MQPHPPAPGLGALGALPPEILQHILFLLVAHTPLGPPAALTPVRLASRALAGAASSPALLARVFRLKFDSGAVVRRLFAPGTREMAAQLVWACRVLQSLRRGLPARPGMGGEGDAALGLDGWEKEARPRSDEAGRRKEGGVEGDADMGPDDTLFGALLLMLDNDGRNYAQLERAGVHQYVVGYVLWRLWDGARDNAGWPVENAAGACALWVMWLTMDRERLMAETPSERENMVRSILPFVFLIHRYPASEAPPNHFHLPLRSNAFSSPLPHAPRTAFYPQLTEGYAAPTTRAPDAEDSDDEGKLRGDEESQTDAANQASSSTHIRSPSPTPTPSPQHYPHYLPPRPLMAPYFRALTPLAPPLASTAAKLLFVAWREVRPFGIPQHLPRDREDAVRQWWVLQVEAARAMQAQHLPPPAQPQPPLPIPPMPAHVHPPAILGPTQADYRALNKGKAAALPRGARWDWEAGCARVVNRDIGDDGLDEDANGVSVEVTRKTKKGKGKEQEQEESRRWDTLWWRMRLCSDFRARQPRFAPGAVFERGCMKGMWQGKIYIPQGNLLMRLIGQNPAYPGFPDAHGLFSEASLGVIMQPVFLEMEEHIRLCGCSKPTTTHSTSSHHTTRDTQEPSSSEEAGDEQHAQQEYEPCGVIPIPPLSGIADWRGVPFAGVLPGDLPAGHPHHGPPPPPPAALDTEGAAAPLVLPPQPLDYSMSNAWLPGGIGELAYESRPAPDGAPLVARRPGGGFVSLEEDVQEEEGKEVVRRRDELVVSTNGRAPDVFRAQGCKALASPLTTSPLTTAGKNPDVYLGRPEECYVYETYDPTRVSAHDVHYEPAPYVGPAHCWPTDAGVAVGVVDPDAEETVNPQCARCVEREAARAAERAKEARKAQRALEKRAAQAGVAALDNAHVHLDALAGVHRVPEARGPSKREVSTEGCGGERETKRRRVGEQEGHAEAQKQLEEMMRRWGQPSDSNVDVEMDGAVEELDVDNFGLRMDDEEMDMQEDEEERDLEDEDEDKESSDEREYGEDEDHISVLGDDIPYGQPGIWTSEPSSTKRTYIPRTRREFARARITSIAAPCAHAADTLFTGHTPACGLAWGQRYTTYGRLRPWDGLVGLVRVGRSPVNFIFIFGYVVGGGTFVGEWRVAASDPMRPAWAGPFVMSRVGA